MHKGCNTRITLNTWTKIFSLKNFYIWLFFHPFFFFLYYIMTTWFYRKRILGGNFNFSVKKIFFFSGSFKENLNFFNSFKFPDSLPSGWTKAYDLHYFLRTCLEIQWQQMTQSRSKTILTQKIRSSTFELQLLPHN